MIVDRTSCLVLAFLGSGGGLSWALYLYEISVFPIFLQYVVSFFSQKRGEEGCQYHRFIWFGMIY